ncbi:YhcN/YlaJ family sporulation lipoprotein [Paenibacillus pasadenensis]|uniref:YhcN/YlaJ family sporulation lipoprotein n=1 Tax=Paenibacillus pasadenensis TaxID=217090 RepID=UPI00203D2328|nr:YhcN/YlaJ family sporulation lipoprotein [Paenibacillus pasadenensis]MCM3746335.1 YhcN/YlaJ family sporulation lipoprotein [Paenibacillus pasadenensis]
MKKRLLAAVWLLCYCTTGCGMDAVREPSPSPAKSERIQAKAAKYEAVLPQNPSESVKQMEELASRVKGVKQARAVVSGDAALIAIELSEKLDSSRPSDVEKAVMLELQKHFQHLYAVVDSSTSFIRQLDEMKKSIVRRM